MICKIIRELEVLGNVDRPWYVCGGWAIDLFVGSQTRDHKDLDLAIARVDQLFFQRHFRQMGWQLAYIESGHQSPWPADDYLRPPLHEIWAEHPAADGVRIELLLNEIDAELFRFRRNTKITRRTRDAWFEYQPGLRVLSPEIVLLYKASQPDKEINHQDMMAALPLLNDVSRFWLHSSIEQIDPAHPWCSLTA